MTKYNSGIKHLKIKSDIIFLDKYGWPVERIIGRKFINFLRIILNTRKIMTRGSWERQSGYKLK